jgi:hypothetical protein
MRSEDQGQSNPLARQRIQVLGLAPAPQWDCVEMLLARWENPTHVEGGLFLEEEVTGHPEQVPLLALRQADEQGVVWGEVWFQPAELPKLIAALAEQLEMNYSARSRRWRGLPDGPVLNFGEEDDAGD